MIREDRELMAELATVTEQVVEFTPAFSAPTRSPSTHNASSASG
jgi:hypothetical protein